MRAAVALLLVGCAIEAPLPPIAPNDVPPTTATMHDARRTRPDRRPKSQKVMLASAQLWAITLSTGAVGGTILGGGVAGRDLGAELTGGGVLVFITAPLFLGALTTTIVAGALYSSEP
jgi:hypothetical protein